MRITNYVVAFAALSAQLACHQASWAKTGSRPSAAARPSTAAPPTRTARTARSAFHRRIPARSRAPIDCLVADPVCGTDEVTYVCGADEAFCHGAEVAYKGECGDRSCWKNQHCPDDEICNPVTRTCQEPCDVKCR